MVSLSTLIKRSFSWTIQERTKHISTVLLLVTLHKIYFPIFSVKILSSFHAGSSMIIPPLSWDFWLGGGYKLRLSFFRSGGAFTQKRVWLQRCSYSKHSKTIPQTLSRVPPSSFENPIPCTQSVSLRVITTPCTDIYACVHILTFKHIYTYWEALAYLLWFSSFFECYLKHFDTAKSQHFGISVYVIYSQIWCFCPKGEKKVVLVMWKKIIFFMYKAQLCLQYTFPHTLSVLLNFHEKKIIRENKCLIKYSLGGKNEIGLRHTAIYLSLWKKVSAIINEIKCHLG